MKKTLICLVLLGLLVPAVRVHAAICSVDSVPAATLLLPYFEVNLDDPNGITTLFEINNASATAILAHVVVWTDLSVPVLDFNVYLTGYDVAPINMRDILNLALPQTASAGQDPSDTISPHGLFSQDINFATCADQLPPPSAAILAPLVPGLQNALLGHASTTLGGNCGGVDHGDNIARGYVTVDTVNNCTLRFPGDPGYFVSGGIGDATNQNVLWGNYYYVSPDENFAQGENLVHIEADALNPETAVPGQYTFYGRYVAWTAADNREPLVTSFAARYVNNAGFDGGTDFLVWRDSKIAEPESGFVCGTLPGPFPLGQEGIVIFDEEEQPDVPRTIPISPQPPGQLLTPFPWEAQRTSVGSTQLPVPFDSGWIFLDLNTTVGANPPEDPLAAQAWVSVVLSAEGRYSVGYDAIGLDSACTANHFVPGGG